MRKFLKINLLKAEHYADAVFIVLKTKHFKELELLLVQVRTCMFGESVID